MLKRKLCEAVITWELICLGPLLIADGRYDQKEVMKPYLKTEEERRRKGWYPDKFFMNKCETEEMIRLVRFSERQPPSQAVDFYVPGTSLRGPFRALAERIIRSLVTSTQSPETACDPFEQDQEKDMCGCSKRQERENDAQIKYAKACPACKLFGYAGLSSRIQIIDSPITQYYSVYRDMIGIDRFTGGVYQGGESGGGANMRLHALENTRFTTTVTVINFELWQLGLLAYVFRDFQEGLAPIGFGKTKGFGQVTGAITKITLAYPKPLAASDRLEHLEHLGSLATDQEKSAYGLHPCEAPTFERLQTNNGGLSLYQCFQVMDIPQFWATVAPVFNAYLEGLNQAAAAPPQPPIETS